MVRGTHLAIPESKPQRVSYGRLALFLLAAVVVVVVWFVASQAMQTLIVLDQVEAERDLWQRPRDIMAALDLHDGSVVADVGSGAGYFTLKLAAAAGGKGSVLAEDILKEPLVFLWIRAHLRHLGNVHVIHGDPDDPHLPEGRLDAVLVANTYHEFAHPAVVLTHLFAALRSGGRMVVVDRGPLAEETADVDHHERDPGAVERELRAAGFEVISRDDRFIDRPPAQRPGDRPDEHTWWMMVARK
jgi:SAM-dependent methyltransferase